MNISNRLTAQKSPRVLAFKSARNYSYVNITQAYSATFRRFAGFNFPENRHTQPKGYSLSLKVDFVRQTSVGSSISKMACLEDISRAGRERAK